MVTFRAEQLAHILCVQRFGPALLQSAVVVLKALEYFRQQRLAVHGMSHNLPQRNGVGRIAPEHGLVHVESHARNRVGYVRAAQIVFQQHSAQLPLLPIDVVGPFHADVRRQFRGRSRHRQCRGFRERKLPVGREEGGVEHHAEQQVLSLFRLPHRALLPVARRLEVRGEQGKFPGQLLPPWLAQLAHCRVRLVQVFGVPVIG